MLIPLRRVLGIEVRSRGRRVSKEGKTMKERELYMLDGT